MRFRSNAEHAAERAEKAAREAVPRLADDDEYRHALELHQQAAMRLRQAEAANAAWKETPMEARRRSRAETSLETGELPPEQPDQPPHSHRDILALREAEKIAGHRKRVAKSEAEHRIVARFKKEWNAEQCRIISDYISACRRASALLERERLWLTAGTKPPYLLKFAFNRAQRDPVFKLIGSGDLSDPDSFCRLLVRKAREAGIPGLPDLDAEYNAKGRAA